MGLFSVWVSLAICNVGQKNEANNTRRMSRYRLAIIYRLVFVGLALSAVSGCAIVQAVYDDKAETECEGYNRPGVPEVPNCRER
jgi:hypothetical protein